MHSGPRLVAAVLGVWFAKAAWTPLDRKSPHKRLEELVRQIQPSVVLCDDASPFQHLDVPLVDAVTMSFNGSMDRNESNLDHLEEPLDQVAQVIYTSGSTGVPKGVIYTHGRLAHSTHFFAEECGVAGSRILQKTPNIWAVFRHEVYPALCRGGLIVHPKPEDASDPRHLAEVISDASVSLLVATPTILELIVDSGVSLSSLRQVVCMGEPLSWRLAGKILKQLPSVHLKNFYGSTETENTIYRVPPNGNFSQESAVPAGQPQPHVSVHLLKVDSLELSDADEDEGEICFAGVMSSGYWQRPDLTSVTFVDHPQLGRLYRTGDLGAWKRGQLHVSGRIDRQVKVRGCRVELQELEFALKTLSSEASDGLGGLQELQECSAVVASAPASHLQIVVFVCPETLDLDLIREQATTRLSPQLMPSLFTALPQLPRLANGKVDLVSLKTLASNSLAKQSTETHAVLDSLGILQHLTKSQIEEDRWIQNQQAFWTLLVMMEHFHFTRGAARSGQAYGYGDSDFVALFILIDVCHCRDMVAFLLLLGFTDSRMKGSIHSLGPRDAAVFITALFMTLIFGPVHRAVLTDWDTFPQVRVGPEWFLYTYFWARVVLLGLCHVARPGLWQAMFMFLMALCPDDLFWLQLPMSLRASLEDNVPLDTKSLKFTGFFLPACYLLSFYASQAGIVTWCKRSGQRLMQRVVEVTSLLEWKLELSFSLACFSQWLVLSLLCGRWPKWNMIPFAYQDGYQAVFVEVGDHTVSWDYMTNPSLLLYLAIWIGEALLLLLPGMFIALGMVYLPWHFKTMGTASFGIYVIHVPIAYTPWIRHFEAPILQRITDPAWNGGINLLIVLAWNALFCIIFAHSIGAKFHQLLVSTLAKIAQLQNVLQQKATHKDIDSVPECV
ncbi:unnamed protein product [Durusdinium trenchii]